MSGAALIGPLLGAEPEIHVWYCDLGQPPAVLAACAELLDPAERERAARFRFERDRQPWIAARGALRRILGAYLGADPRLVRFALGPRGKPELDPPGPLHFNLSHSHRLMALALAGRLVGVDVEYERFDLDHAELAASVFSAAERAALAAADDPPQAFFRIWARKEAFIKALGAGLSHPLDSFDVSSGDGSAALLATRPDPAEAARWALAALRPGPGYAGALAVAAPGGSPAWRLVERRWPLGAERDGIGGA